MSDALSNPLPAPAPSLTILYTYGLHGRLDALPRLYTLIKRVRSSESNPVILLDLGESCRRELWLCEVTTGRAMLVALDAMGYDAFYIAPADPLYTDALTFGKLRATILTPLLSDCSADSASLLLTKHGHAGQSLSVQITTMLIDHQTASADLTVQIAPDHAESVSVDIARRTLLLTGNSQNDDILLGRLAIDFAPFRIAQHERIKLSTDESPDATLSSVVEFVESEARYASSYKATRSQK